MNNLGNYLRELRGSLSMREAAKRIGISHTYLDKIEKGRDPRSGKPIKPTPETLRMISKAYNCDYEELMVVAGYIESNQSKKEKDIELESLTPNQKKIYDWAKSQDGLFFHEKPEDLDELLKEFELVYELFKKRKQKEK
ncbi:helix-turn-helix domain-containing protein [Bacillus sp. FSL K6-1560]|uniref:helix-turn-helix domain-containing protein n=1 Tax=Bacillus sp. FSL K6-1560 TaxID=2975293 RepID=UPI00315973FE